MKQKDFVMQTSINDCGVACLNMILNLNGINEKYDRLKDKFSTVKEGVSVYEILRVSKQYKIDANAYKDYKLEDIKEPLIAHLINDNNLQHFVVVLNVLEEKVLLADPSSKIMYVTKDWFIKHYTGVVLKFNNNIVSPKKIIIKNKRLIINIILTTVFLSLLNVAGSYTLPYLLKLIEQRSSMKIMMIILLIFLCINLLKDIIAYFKNNLNLKFQILIDRIVTIPLLNKLICLPHSFYQKNASGELISKVNDMSYVKDMICKCIEVIFINLIFFLVSIIFISVISIKMIIIIVLFLFIYVMVNKIYYKKKYFQVRDMQIKDELLSSEIMSSFSGILTIKNLLKEKYFCNRINNKYDETINTYKQLSKSFVVKDLVQNIVISIISILSFGICVYDNLDISNIIFIVFLQNIIIDSIKNIFDIMPLYLNYKNILIRIKSIIEEKSINESSMLLDINHIQFKNVSFKYNENKVLNKVYLDINKNDWILVTGVSGSGKTTLFKLLTKQEKAKGIYINNVEINNISDEDIRKNITFVDQKIKLFSDTIKNNIFLDKEFSEKPLSTALVNQLTKNNFLDYNYVIDNTNSNLSGGQIQKILIAQTLANGSNVIIFDETTSQLDEITERKILKNIKNNYPEKTVVLISHRNTNKDLFNKVINFDKGKINLQQKGVIKCKN